MSRLQQFSPDLLQLMVAAVDGSVNQAELADLEVALRRDAAASLYFLDLCQLEVDLQLHERATASTYNVLEILEQAQLEQPLAAPTLVLPSSEKATAGITVSISPRWAAGVLVTLLVGYFVGLAALVSKNARNSQQEDVPVAGQRNSPTSSVAIGTLADTADCEWGGARRRIVGSSLFAGERLLLNSGLAEFEFRGVRAVVEGPASIELRSASDLFLHRGKLAVRVTPAGIGFTVQTRSAKIVDLGTEFGVKVEANGNEQVQVFRGRVRLATSTTAANKGGAVVELHAGQGVQFDARLAAMQPIVADASQFTTDIDSPPNPIVLGSLTIGEAYVQEVKKASPIAYWRFEREHEGMIPNEMGVRWPARTHAGVQLVGHPTSRRALFSEGNKIQYIEVEETLDALGGQVFSLELWVKPARFVEAELLRGYQGQSSNGRDTFALSIVDQGDATVPSRHIRFLHRNPPGSFDGTHVVSRSRYTPGIWHHIVGVKRGSEMSMYVNGELAGIGSDATEVRSDARLFMGCLQPTETQPNMHRQLVGELDEVAIYNRALSAEEVRHHYMLGCRESTPGP